MVDISQGIPPRPPQKRKRAEGGGQDLDLDLSAMHPRGDPSTRLKAGAAVQRLTVMVRKGDQPSSFELTEITVYVPRS